MSFLTTSFIPCPFPPTCTFPHSLPFYPSILLPFSAPYSSPAPRLLPLPHSWPPSLLSSPILPPIPLLFSPDLSPLPCPFPLCRLLPSSPAPSPLQYPFTFHLSLPISSPCSFSLPSLQSSSHPCFLVPCPSSPLTFSHPFSLPIPFLSLPDPYLILCSFPFSPLHSLLPYPFTPPLFFPFSPAHYLFPVTHLSSPDPSLLS